MQRQEEAGIRQASKNLPSGGLLSNLDSRCNIQNTPGNRPGAELQLEDLLEQKIEEHLKEFNHQDSPAVKVKISGDGARMPHSSSLLVCFFSILDEGQHVLSCAAYRSLQTSNYQIVSVSW